MLIYLEQKPGGLQRVVRMWHVSSSFWQASSELQKLQFSKPGFNESVGKWMTQEAKKRNIGPEGREGGIILDEVAIQVYLYIKKTNHFI